MGAERSRLIEAVEVDLAQWVMDSQQRGASSLAQLLKLMGTYGAAALLNSLEHRSHSALIYLGLCVDQYKVSTAHHGVWLGRERRKEGGRKNTLRRRRLVSCLETNIAVNSWSEWWRQWDQDHMRTQTNTLHYLKYMFILFLCLILLPCNYCNMTKLLHFFSHSQTPKYTYFNFISLFSISSPTMEMFNVWVKWINDSSKLLPSTSSQD